MKIERKESANHVQCFENETAMTEKRLQGGFSVKIFAKIEWKDTSKDPTLWYLQIGPEAERIR